MRNLNDDVQRELARRRVGALGLAVPAGASPAEVVAGLGAVQSQDYGPAKWSIGERCAPTAAGVVTDAELDRAYAAGDILRVHTLRPTWHFVNPKDLRWMQQATAERVHAFNGYYYRQQGIDDAIIMRSRKVIESALQGGHHLTRTELDQWLQAAKIEVRGIGLALVVMHAELSGLVCSGVMSGRQHTYALVDERVAAAPALDAEEALGRLVLRYFRSHGPATAKDCQWWCSLKLADVRRGIEIAGRTLQHEMFGATSFWSASDAPQRLSSVPTVHLLQGFDECFVGYSESKWVIDVSGAARAVPEGRSLPNGVVLLDGQAAGHWKRTVSTTVASFELQLHREPTDQEVGALHTSAERQAAFLERDSLLTMTVST